MSRRCPPKVIHPRFYRCRNCLRSHTLVNGGAGIEPRYLGSRIQAFTHYTVLFGEHQGMLPNTHKPLHFPLDSGRKRSCLKPLSWVGQASWTPGIGRVLPAGGDWGHVRTSIGLCSRRNKGGKGNLWWDFTVNCSTHGKQGLMEPQSDQPFIQPVHRWTGRHRITVWLTV